MFSRLFLDDLHPAFPVLVAGPGLLTVKMITLPNGLLSLGKSLLNISEKLASTNTSLSAESKLIKVPSDSVIVVRKPIAKRVMEGQEQWDMVTNRLIRDELEAPGSFPRDGCAAGEAFIFRHEKVVRQAIRASMMKIR